MASITTLFTGKFRALCSSRLSILTALAVLLCGTAWGDGIYIFTEDKVPQWNQIHDYRGTYGGRATNIETMPGSGVFVPYDMLRPMRTFFRHTGTVLMPGGRRPTVVLNPANPGPSSSTTTTTTPPTTLVRIWPEADGTAARFHRHVRRMGAANDSHAT